MFRAYYSHYNRSKVDTAVMTAELLDFNASYQTETFQTRFKTFTGWTAQIIQHEIDHCEGILI